MKKEEGHGVAEVEDGGEISSELQQLLQRLEAKIESSSEAGQSLGWIRVEADEKHLRIFHDLFDIADKSYKSRKECRLLLGAQAKLRLLHAIGSCGSLRRIVVEDLTGNDLEALLTPMQSNPVLEYIHIAFQNPSAGATCPASGANDCVGRICDILGRILQTSRTLEDLRLLQFVGGFTATNVSHLASGVCCNAESALKVFHVGKWKESSVANQVAEIVLSAPRLEELHVRVQGVMDDDGIEALANALTQSTSLKLLRLHAVVRGASALLLKALTGDGSNKSIETLTRMSSSSWWEFFRST